MLINERRLYFSFRSWPLEGKRAPLWDLLPKQSSLAGSDIVGGVMVDGSNSGLQL
jgi:hypothetical protein